jgi:hypothetical protein
MSAKAKGLKRTCMEEAELESGKQAPTKQARFRVQNTEQQVAKAIKDNCADLTPAEVDGTKVQGLTLRETLYRDKRAAKAGETKETFGKKYYERLRATFSSQESPANQLLCGEDSMPVNPDLFTAMVSLKKTPVNRRSAQNAKKVTLEFC